MASTASTPGSPMPSVLCLAGPTASGKSALALSLAEQIPLEIISVDSALVYRHMDIGSAKPSAAERAAVPHHLIDIRDPGEPWSAAEFARDARRLIDEIRARGRLPLLVGGTMLYYKALFARLDDMPAADAGVRHAIDERARRLGWPTLHAELARIDPAAAARLAPLDSQRIQRALEVWQLTGRTLSSFHAGNFRATPADWSGAVPLVSLEPFDRAWLHQRIETRWDAMLAAGFIDEVKALRARGDLSPALPALRAVGYRQAWQALDEGWTPDQLRTRAIAATRQLAKRQLTWLRALPGRQVLAIGPDVTPEQLRGAVLARIRNLA